MRKVSFLLISVLLVAGTVTAYGEGQLEYPFYDSCPVSDTSGNNRDGSCNGDLTYNNDGVSRNLGDWDYDNDSSYESLSFDGNGDYIETGNDFTDGSAFTVSAWVKVQGTNNQVIAQSNDGSNQFVIKRHANGAGQWSFYTYDGSNVHGFDSVDVGVPEGSWQHVAFVYTDSETMLGVEQWQV